MPNKLDKSISNIKDGLEKKAQATSKALIQGYKRSLTEIRKEVGLIYAKHSTDGVLDVTRRQRVAILQSLDKKLVKQARRLGALERDIATTAVKTSISEAYYRTLYEIDRGLSTAVDFSLLNPTFVNKAITNKIDGKTLSDRVWNNKKILANRVKRDVEKAMIQGTPIDKLSRQLKKDYGSSAYESTRLIQNETKNAVTEAQLEAYSESGVVDKVMWVSTLDERTRDDHQDFDGNIYDADNPEESPTDYIMCRCVLVPVIEGWTPSVRRDNATGEDINYTTYNKWKESRGI